MAIYNKIVPDEFDVPLIVKGDGFILRPLSPEYSDLDYDAVMESKSILNDIFSENWPEDINSAEENLAYIQEDYQDFKDRVGFSYIILDPDETICLGCVYIFPSLFEGSDVAIYYWFNIKIADTKFSIIVEKFIRKWIKNFWKIKKPAYPGRDIPWAEWLNRPRKSFPSS
ncbi:hypothetical protein QT13_14930 [Pectobacterium brasiliense]|uniref:hypothetical protein n=1 Tax=Pectobacterium brasiliense TaxID=180957 RepID=UPI00057D6D24|nr:hypothetical protein [Pectobacterium brasiliense]KHS67086.1 hypothetical protein QT13_14930 [Pectobacterium brasiliense]KHS87124.1 hypothetical protein RC83_13510 [Pectobacterium brasiliense]